MFLSAILAMTVVAAGGGPTNLQLMPTGAMKKIGYYIPQALTLTEQRPAGLKGGPTGAGVLYGTIKFGPRGHQASYAVALLDTDEQHPVLYLDTNHDGKLTESEKVAWEGKTQTLAQRDGTKMETLTFFGDGKLLSGKDAYGISMYRFSRADEARRNFKGQRILYFRDYARVGKVTVGSKAYDAILSDEAATGDFTPAGADDKMHALLFDLNGNGRYGERGEKFDVNKPFNIAGVTYEISGLTPSGDRLNVVKSKQEITEVAPPPTFAVGGKVPSFKATGVDGKPVDFPNDYKGKVVLLDFWATWCGPCVGEIPNVIKTYNEYHSKGLEILGISLDQENQEQKLKDFVRERNMPWQQVYDGKYWQAAIAVKYGIESIPHMFLIDGDTGKIIAHGDEIRGENLGTAVAKALSGH